MQRPHALLYFSLNGVTLLIGSEATSLISSAVKSSNTISQNDLMADLFLHGEYRRGFKSITIAAKLSVMLIGSHEVKRWKVYRAERRLERRH